MKKIKLTQGKETIIDDIYFAKVSKYKWHYDNRYAATYISGKKVRLHRFIMNNPVGLQIDHKNMDCLDNRKSNLRIATKSQNMMNRGKQINSNKYKGVHQRKSTNKWQAYIKINGKKIHLGYYATAKEAGERYNNAAKEYFGEFARLNEIN